MAILMAYALLLLKLNGRSMLVSPVCFHLAYLALYIVVPAVVLFDNPSLVPVGKYAIVIDDACLRLLDVSIVCLGIGALIAGRKNHRIKGSLVDRGILKDDLADRIHGRRINWILVFAVAITMVFFVVNRNALSFLSSPDALLKRYAFVEEFKINVEYGSNYLLQGLAQIVPILSVLFLAKWYLTGQRGYKICLYFLVPMDLLCLFLFGAVWVGFAMLFMLILVREYFHPLNIKQLLWYPIIFSVLIFLVMAYKYGYVSEQGVQISALQSLVTTLAGSRFTAGARQLQFVLDEIPRYVSHLHGMSYIHDVIALIPSPIKRSIFPENYWVDFNGYMYLLMYGTYGGTAQIPVMGEFYSDFGIAGVAVGSLFYGYAVQRASNLFASRAFGTLSRLVCGIVLGYRLAEATVEGLGERFLVSVVWIVILYFVLCPVKRRTAATRAQWRKAQGERGSEFQGAGG